MSNRIVVIGGGGHAKVLISILKLLPYSVVGYLDVHDNGPILGVPYLGGDEKAKQIREDDQTKTAALGIGTVGLGHSREAVKRRFDALRFQFPAIIAPSAIVDKDARVESGTVVFPGAVINAGARLGIACIVNSNSTVEHDCQIGNFVHIAPGATLSGDVRVGDYTLIGVGAVVVQGCSVGPDCIIGGGAVVANSECVFPGTYVGIPAKRI